MIKKQILLAAVIAFATLLLLSIALINTFDRKNALAQVASPINATHLLTYQNQTAGFKIEYPSFWQKSENITSNSSTVYLFEPISGARFAVANFKIPQINLLNESKNLILSTYLNAFTQPFQPYNSTQSSSITIAGNPANKTELTYISHGNPARAMILSSLIGDKVYIVSYAASKANYALLLPYAQGMVNSFAILPVTNTTMSTSTTANSTFHSVFDKFVVPGSVGGYGAYQEHNSSTFKPGEKILLYIEPAGFSYKPVGSQFLMNFTADVSISDKAGHILGGFQNLPISTIISHHQNKELILTVSLTQTNPFPPGDYVLKYRIHDVPFGSSFDILKNITIATG